MIMAMQVTTLQNLHLLDKNLLRKYNLQFCLSDAPVKTITETDIRKCKV